MATWPSIPAFQINTYKESSPDNTIRSSMGIGVDKVRRRTTASPYQISFQLILTTAQLTTLETFYNTTTVGGSVRFDFTHPRTGATVKARFVSPPSWSDIYARAYRVEINLEILP